MNSPLDILLRRRLEGDVGCIPDDNRSATELPTLWSFLTRRDVDGNLSKEPATINVRLGLGTWLVTLTDPSLEVSLTTTVNALADALPQLERAVNAPSAPWSPWRRSKGKFDKVHKKSPGQEPARNND